MALHTRALVAAKWLADAVKCNRVGPSLRILDTSWYLPQMKRNGKKEFKERHIPGATFFDIDECCDKTSPFDRMLPTERTFADYVGNLGIGNDTHVVVYDASDFGSFSSPRVWWMFRVFGHNSVSVLNGGLKYWLHEGNEVTSQYSKPQPVDFRTTINRSWVKTYQDVLDNIDTKQFQFVDARPAGRFKGTVPEPRHNTEPGHIPGSFSMPFNSLLSPSGLILPPEELEDLFRKAGVDLRHPICVSCGSGVTACQVVLAAHVLGYPGVTVYDGAGQSGSPGPSPKTSSPMGEGSTYDLATCAVY